MAEIYLSIVVPAYNEESRIDATLRTIEMQRVEGFGFDRELLFLIERLGGKIVEVPVCWVHHPMSKVHFPRDPIRMFLDLVSLRMRANRAEYSS
jgi:hypothetical protein